MSATLRIFVSSVQKELEDERLIVQKLVSTDPFVTFPGPGENIERLRVPEKRLIVTPAVEAQLNERQKDMVNRMVAGEELTSRRCQELYDLSPQAVYQDFKKLIGLGVARKIGSGRSTRYGYNPHE